MYQVSSSGLIYKTRSIFTMVQIASIQNAITFNRSIDMQDDKRSDAHSCFLDWEHELAVTAMTSLMQKKNATLEKVSRRLIWDIGEDESECSRRVAYIDDSLLITIYAVDYEDTVVSMLDTNNKSVYSKYLLNNVTAKTFFTNNGLVINANAHDGHVYSPTVKTSEVTHEDS